MRAIWITSDHMALMRAYISANTAESAPVRRNRDQLRKLLPSNGAGMSGGTKPPKDACHRFGKWISKMDFSTCVHMRTSALVVRAYTVLVNVYVENVAENVSFLLGSPLPLDSLGEFWKSALHKSNSVPKPPGRGRVRKEWTTMEPDSEIKLVRVSGGASRACFLCEIRV